MKALKRLWIQSMVILYILCCFIVISCRHVPDLSIYTIVLIPMLHMSVYNLHIFTLSFWFIQLLIFQYVP